MLALLYFQKKGILSLLELYLKKNTKGKDQNMAQAIDLNSTATCLEGQLLMIIEALVNHQDDTTADTGTNRDNIQMITTSAYNDLNGSMQVALNIIVTSTQAENGFTLTADEVFYPKTSELGGLA